MGKSNAERQREYREKRRAGRNDERQLNTWISTDSYLSLGRLARHEEVTMREILERLVIDADKKVIAGLDENQPEWYLYFNVTQ